MSDISSLTKLLQLASPALPVGAFSYSQGMESAVEAGIVIDAASAQNWIGDVLDLSLATLEAPMVLRLCRAWSDKDDVSVQYGNALFLASREAAELRAETVQMGYSMRRLLVDLDSMHGAALACLQRLDEIAYPTAYAFAVTQWRIDPHQALIAYLWSWLENQVMSAIKAVPLGQTDGQRILLALGDTLSSVAERAESMRGETLGSFAPGLAILSSRHETQYSRLFRS
jgi:urease accessory protein